MILVPESQLHPIHHSLPIFKVVSFFQLSLIHSLEPIFLAKMPWAVKFLTFKEKLHYFPEFFIPGDNLVTTYTFFFFTLDASGVRKKALSLLPSLRSIAPCGNPYVTQQEHWAEREDKRAGRRQQGARPQHPAQKGLPRRSPKQRLAWETVRIRHSSMRYCSVSTTLSRVPATETKQKSQEAICKRKKHQSKIDEEDIYPKA